MWVLACGMLDYNIHFSEVEENSDSKYDGHIRRQSCHGEKEYRIKSKEVIRMSDYKEENLQTWEGKKRIEAQIEVDKKYALANIETYVAKQKAEQLLDIHARHQLQRTRLSCTEDGSVVLLHEGFTEKVSGMLPLKIKAMRCYCHIGDVQPTVLTLIVEKENGEEVALFWHLEQLEDRHIRKVFERQGILLGYGEKKEKEIRRQILQMTRNRAKNYEIPEEHGWYKVDDNWKYALPENITWKEVNELC